MSKCCVLNLACLVYDWQLNLSRDGCNYQTFERLDGNHVNVGIKIDHRSRILLKQLILVFDSRPGMHDWRFTSAGLPDIKSTYNYYQGLSGRCCFSMINSNSKFVYAFICRLDNSSHLFSPILFSPDSTHYSVTFNLTSSDKLTNDQSVKNHLDIKRRRSLGSSTLAHASGWSQRRWPWQQWSMQ